MRHLPRHPRRHICTSKLNLLCWFSCVVFARPAYIYLLPVYVHSANTARTSVNASVRLTTHDFLLPTTYYSLLFTSIYSFLEKSRLYRVISVSLCSDFFFPTTHILSLPSVCWILIQSKGHNSSPLPFSFLAPTAPMSVAFVLLPYPLPFSFSQADFCGGYLT